MFRYKFYVAVHVIVAVPEWISRILVLHAQVLLKSSKQTVQQIALELNFPNASFFGRFFKKHTGMTPGQYRLKS